ncbi:MAG TPA: hypothetical protein VMI35_14375 [Puia sp.]|nr:hypothetical protein [Puia sp.]
MLTFSEDNFHALCDTVSARDGALKKVLRQFGYPPMWTRPASFRTLIHIVLEQQVSLASALAALRKLEEKIQVITPENLLTLDDAALKSCYFSRQKSLYAREIAGAMVSGVLDLDRLADEENEIIRNHLKKIKGIGDWTVDIYLLMALQRTDIFPLGDLAMINSLKQLKKLPAGTAKDALLKIADKWRPLRSIATMILWHHYLEQRRK